MTAPRSIERARLAAAIERVAACDAEIAGIDAALAKIGRSGELFGTLDAAQRAIAAAEQSEPRRLVDETLGRPTGQSLADAIAARDGILAEQERRQNMHRLLGSERDVIDGRREHAIRKRGDEIATVVRGSAAVDRLLNDLRVARARVDELEAVGVSILDCLPSGGFNWDRAGPRAAPAPTTVAAVHIWRAALAALETDPDARLPGDADDDEQIAAAA